MFSNTSMELSSTNDVLKMTSDSKIVSESKPEVWRQVIGDEEEIINREETEEYIKNRELENAVPISPEIAYLNETIFPILKPALIETLLKVKDDNSFTHLNGTLNGLDHLSEILYNRNPNYPERQSNWTYIFDMQWVQDFLGQKPRPHYPFHLIWTKEFAAIKIQSFMRGYWVRSRPEVQELRLFWKTLKYDTP